MGARDLDLARAGDEAAFAELVRPHTRELQLHCYRMLGSFTDAEDLLQETLTAAWRGLPGFEGSSSLRTWLYAIATNRCLNAIRAAKRRPPAEPVPPFVPPPPSRRGEVTWLQPYPDELLDQLPDDAPGPAARYQLRESVELAFIVALQRLPPRQTAAIILCDVLGFSLAEAATMLGTGATAIKGLLQRARAGLDGSFEPSTAPAVDTPQQRDLVRRFAHAFSAGDVDGVIALLTDDAWLAMPPAPHEYHGREAIAAFLRVSTTERVLGGWRLRLSPTRANRQPAFDCRLVESDTGEELPAGQLVLTLRGDRIRALTRFLIDVPE